MRYKLAGNLEPAWWPVRSCGKNSCAFFCAWRSEFANIATRSPSMSPARSILRGELDKIGLPTLLTILDMEKRGGVLILQKGKQLGRLFVRDGRVIRAQLEGEHRLSGIDAVVHFLSWPRGVFELWQADVLGPDEV